MSISFSYKNFTLTWFFTKYIIKQYISNDRQLKGLSVIVDTLYDIKFNQDHYFVLAKIIINTKK